jgi:hypothetical protein
MIIAIIADISPNAKGLLIITIKGFWITIVLNFFLGLFNSFQ